MKEENTYLEAEVEILKARVLTNIQIQGKERKIIISPKTKKSPVMGMIRAEVLMKTVEEISSPKTQLINNIYEHRICTGVFKLPVVTPLKEK
ncbi:hypothetical protein JTB14_035837 [Gonioctena quinquepunctata]|nr:hypothetical protein JTB14_035837 [Gonioctena quinquepunctata]